jgi:replicative DNA helicase
MSKEQLVNRLFSLESYVDAQLLRTGNLKDSDWEKLIEGAGTIGRSNLIIDDTPGISISEMRSKCRKYKMEHNLELIIIDYLQLCDMNTGQKNRNREQEVAQATRKAKLLAKELNVPVVLLCQLNRESEGRPGGRPELFHLRESGAIEQDADVVMLLYRPALARLTTDRESGYPTEGLGVVIVAKQRNGETGNAYFSHNPSLTKITDYTPPLEVLLKQAK